MNQPAEVAPGRTGRNLGIAAFIGVVIAYLVLLQGLPWLTGPSDQEYGEFPDAETLLRTVTLATGVAVVLVVALISWLGWWKRVWRDDLPVQSWVWIVPVGFFVAALVMTD